MLLGFIGLNSQAQIKEYQEVVVADHATKDELYKKAKIYFVDNFKSANDVIQYQDAEEGKIIGKGYFEIQDVKNSWGEPFTLVWDVYYTTSIECKDGKYRYSLYDINIREKSSSGALRINEISKDYSISDIYNSKPKNLYKQQYNKLLKELSEQFDLNILTLKNSMIKNSSIASAKEW